MTTLRVFVSSPGDVELERQIARRVLARLDGEFAGDPGVEPYFWEYEPMRLSKDFQTQIQPPSSFDIVVCILWARLGSPLGPHYRRPDGTLFQSGTEYEFEDAIESFRASGTPDILVYRNRTDPPLKPRPKEELERQLKQLDALDAFLETWTRDGSVFKAAITTYTDVAQFEELLTEHIRKLILQRRETAGSEQSAHQNATWTHGSPFRGLEAFEFEHAPVFRGRTRAVQDVIGLIRRELVDRQAWTAEAGGDRPPPQFVLVTAGSGMGKSSLVRAGVMPLLTSPGVVGTTALWRRATMKAAGSGDDLFGALAQALVAPEALPELRTDGTTPEQLAATMRANPAGTELLVRGALSQAAAELRIREDHQLGDWERDFRSQGRVADAEHCRLRRESGKNPEASLAILIDQLEEIFTLPVAEQSTFLQAVDALARGGRAVVIATLRSDFLTHVPETPELAGLAKGGGIYPLQPANRTELAHMIRDPAREAGLRFEEDAATGQRLDDVVLEAVAQDPTSLPLLEFALDQLYQRRTPDSRLTFAAYRDIDGVEGAIGRRAEEEFARLSDEHRAGFDMLFGALVHLSDLRSTERPVRRRAALADFDRAPAAAEFARHFVGARLLVSEPDAAGRASISVAHEALLSHWTRLRGWIDTHRDLLRIRGRVEQAAGTWESEGRPADLLLSEGRLLAEAGDLLRQTASVPITSGTAEFIARSSRAQGRRRRRRLVLAACVGIGLTLAAVISGLQWRSLTANRIQAAEIAYRTSIATMERQMISGGPRGVFDGANQKLGLDVLKARQTVVDVGGELPTSDVPDMARIHEYLGILAAFQGNRTTAEAEFAIREALNTEATEKKLTGTISAGIASPYLGTVLALHTELFIANVYLKLTMHLQPKQDDVNFASGMEFLWQARVRQLADAEGREMLFRIQDATVMILTEKGDLDAARAKRDEVLNTTLTWLASVRGREPGQRKASDDRIAYDAVITLMKKSVTIGLTAKRPDEAIGWMRRTAETMENDPTYGTAAEIADMRGTLAEYLMEVDRTDEAIRERDAAIASLLATMKRRIPRAWTDYAEAVRTASDLAVKTNDAEMAISLLVNGLRLVDAAADASPQATLDLVSLLCWRYDVAGRFADAEALVRPRSSKLAEAPQLQINFAHALLFQGKDEEAMALYRAAAVGWVTDDSGSPSFWAQVVLSDLDLLAKRGWTSEATGRLRLEMTSLLEAARAKYETLKPRK